MDISSKATQSVKSSVMNLSTKDQSIKYVTVTEAVAQLFCQIYAPGKDVKVILMNNCMNFHFYIYIFFS